MAALAGISGCAFVWWLRAPVLDTVSIHAWKVAALVGGAAIGGIGVVVVRAWLHVTIAVAVGLVGGAAWAEFWFNDVKVGVIESLVAGTSNNGRVLLPLCVAALLGSFSTQAVLRRAARHQRVSDD